MGLVRVNVQKDILAMLVDGRSQVTTRDTYIDYHEKYCSKDDSLVYMS